MKKTMITLWGMIGCLAMNAQPTAELRSHRNPAVEGLMEYARSLDYYVGYAYDDYSGQNILLSLYPSNDNAEKTHLLLDSIRHTCEVLSVSAKESNMWELHQELIPNTKRTSYDQFGFIIWNWMEEAGDNPYFDEEEEHELVKSGVKTEDIQLTNAGIQHMEKELVSLLKAGASPYFLVTIPDIMEAYIDKNGKLRHTYFDVAPMLEVTKVHSCDYWWEYIGDDLENDISSLPMPTLESIIEGLFNVGACERILHLTDKYICEQARHEGELLMLEQLGEIHSITK